MSTSQANNEQPACPSVQNDCVYSRDRCLEAGAGYILINAQGSTLWIRFTTLHTYMHCTSENKIQHRSSIFVKVKFRNATLQYLT